MKTNLRTIFDISDKDLSHHKMRISNLVNTNTDKEKRLKMTENMAKKILHIDKAYGRYLVCIDLLEYELAEIFLLRFKELTYTISDWRKEKINNFLNNI